MAIKAEKLLTVMYNKELTTVFIPGKALYLPFVKIQYTFSPNGVDSYCSCDEKPAVPVFRIVFGGETVRRMAYVPTSVASVTAAYSHVKKLDIVFKGLYYHEMGHLMFTDLRDRRIYEYDEKYSPFIHKLMNILEDVVVERYGMGKKYPYVQKYFKYLENEICKSQTSYIDTGTPHSFLDFLFYKLRSRGKFTGTNKNYEDHKKQIVPSLKAILLETNATERITKTILLAEYLIKNITWDFTAKTLPPPSAPIIGSPSAGSGGSGYPLPMATTPKKKPAPSGKKEEEEEEDDGEGGSSPTKPSEDSSSSGVDSGGDSGGDSGDRGAPTDGDSPDKDAVKKVEDLDALAEDAPYEDTYDSANDKMIDTCKEVSDVFNEVLPQYDNYVEIHAKDYVESTDTAKQYVDKTILEVSPLAVGVAKALSVYKNRVRPRYNRGFPTGKLDIRSAMNNSLKKGCETKLFEKKVANGVAPDLCVSILCDNSGSMGGNKATVCTRAMIALAKACHMSNIPLDVTCFTSWNDKSIWTVRLKGFDDSFNDMKQYFGYTDDSLMHCYNFDKEYIPHFYGNVDEVNIYFLAKQLEKVKHRDKLLIVISDGETCGATYKLKNLVDSLCKKGINVLGLGIQSKAVTRAYSEYELFDTKESLERLPEYLTKVLLKYAKKTK